MKLTQALDPIISSLKEEKAFLETYLPRELLGIKIPSIRT